MKKVICPNGHFYDADAYASCPHCESGIKPMAPSVFDSIVSEKKDQEPKEIVKEKHSFFKRKSEPEKEFVSQKDIDVTTETLPINDLDRNYYSGKGNVSQKNEDVDEIPSVCFQAEENAGGSSVKPNPQTVEEPKPMKAEDNPTPASENVSAAQLHHAPSTDMDEVKTLGFFSARAFDEPPTGYLICTKGEDFGTGFPLKTGNNTIGRSKTMDIVISDPKVSRDRQAYIMYEPKKREFFFKPGEGNGLCYVNDELVMEHVKIKDYDKISLGDTELFLLTVCNEKFSWDELEGSK